MTIHSTEILEALQRYFPDQNQYRLQQFANLIQNVESLKEMEGALPLSPDEQRTFSASLNEARHHLEFRKPYTLAVVGVTGAGKSTLINALLGDNVLKARAGESVTGTLVTVQQIIDTTVSEPVRSGIIEFYSPSEITQIIEDTRDEARLPQSTLVYRETDRTMLDFSATLDALHTASTASRSAKARKLVEEAVDLLEAALRHRDYIDAGQLVVGELDPGRTQWLKDVMDEQSPVNKDPEHRLIPIIREIIIEVRKQPTGAFSQNVNLTDVPGTLANVMRHKRRLQDQLDPDRNNAIILVMNSIRPGLNIEDLIELVRGSMMGRLQTDEQRRRAAGRFFLVISDFGSFDQPEQSRAELEASLRKVAAGISDTFYDEYRDNIGFEIVAPIALQAQMALAHPQQAEAWLAGEPSAAFDGFRASEYRTRIPMAQHETNLKNEHDALLEWSGVPRLQERLNKFLHADRFARDLEDATASFDIAYKIAQSAVTQQWRKVSGGMSAKNPRAALEHFATHRRSYYLSDIERQADEMRRRFDHVIHSLHAENSLSRDALLQTIDEINAEVLHHIAQQVKQMDFRKRILKGLQTAFITYDFGLLSADALKELDEGVFTEFDNRARRLADRMINQLELELHEHQVLGYLQALHPYWDKARDYVDAFDEGVIGQLRKAYGDKCRGALFTRLKEFAVVLQVVRKVTDFGTLLEEQSYDNVAGMTIEQIIEIYTETFGRLRNTINKALYDLFIYELWLARRENLEQIIIAMRVDLIQDVGEEGRLYQYYEAQDNLQKSQLETLVDLLERLQSMRSISVSTGGTALIGSLPLSAN